jgi:hypothetical protein
MKEQLARPGVEHHGDTELGTEAVLFRPYA